MVKNYASVELIKAIVSLRSIKEDVEIAEIEKACEVGYQMHTTAMRMAKPGISEQDIVGAIEGVAIPWLHAIVPYHPLAKWRNPSQPRPFPNSHFGSIALG